jgi:hypothetical protein
LFEQLRMLISGVFCGIYFRVQHLSKGVSVGDPHSEI